MQRLAPAMLLVLAVGTLARAEGPGPAPTSSAHPSAVPTAASSGPSVPGYPGMTLIVGSQPSSQRAGTAKTPALERFEAYVTPDGYEQVVRFYQGKLGLSPTSAHPKNLAATFPGQAIPARCQGRRSVFRVTPRAPAGGDQPVEQRILAQALGATNVVVSDFSVDPKTHQLVDQTSIVLLVYH